MLYFAYITNLDFNCFTSAAVICICICIASSLAPHPQFVGQLADYVMAAIDIINLYLAIEPIKWANSKGNNISGNLQILLMPNELCNNIVVVGTLEGRLAI